ncbi:MAG TPA: MBL fold metallo-hydrolase [Methylomirabilota bacterium]|nr:MBL fold metallo-hydrolase [Methylomirabilota bacterium]
MGDSPGQHLRLTVLGCSTAAPHLATPTAGYLVQWGDTNLLLDAGQGVVRRLQRVLDPRDLTAVVIGHMHGDHYLDLVGLRYLFPWGEPAERPLAVHLPPGGRARLDALATAVSERAGFFDASFRVVEYDPTLELTVGELRVRFVEGRHYVPAWGVVVEAPDGARLAYTGDTGPSAAVEDAVRGADLLLVESSIASVRHDDAERGHLTANEAIALAEAAEARAALLIHYDPDRRPELGQLAAAAGSWVRPAVDGLIVTIDPDPARAELPRPSQARERAPA